MDYRIDIQGLMDIFSVWDGFLKKRVRLIACGGTALTLLGIKPSTKDIDLIIPEVSEYEYLIDTIKQLGYHSATSWGWTRDDGFIFDIFRGKLIHTTELLESPLNKGNHIFIKEYTHIYLGVLNYYDLIISKVFRSTAIDIEDGLSLIRDKRKDILLDKLIERFRETAAYDVSEDRVNKNFDHFLRILKKEGLYHEK